MTIEVRFDKRRYHQHEDMITWCRANVGIGGWTWATPKDWTGLKDIWCIHSAFGNTVFCFKEEADASMFILRWE
jgi:hypothetical protein